MPKTLNIAVIGAGTMAQSVHLPVLRRRWDRFAVTALVDHSERRRRESSEVWGVEEERRYESVSDLVAAIRAKTVAVDAAVLSTDGLHVDDLLQLIRRGIPVLVEPPLGYSAEEIAAISDFERMAGRRFVMMAYPQQHDEAALDMVERLPARDIRMLDYEVLMPAAQPLFGAAHVTASAYDLPPEVRSARRNALQEAVEAGSGAGATQRDRDLYVKGLLTGLAHQMAVLEATYGPLTNVMAVRHWPKGVIPGSIEVLGELESGAPVRLVWHYLPFAAEYSERIQVLSARRRMLVQLQAPSHGDSRSTLSLREKNSGVLVESGMVATRGNAEAMWEDFHSFVEKGGDPRATSAAEAARVLLLREVLARIVEADGRTIDPEPEPEEAVEPEPAPEPAPEAVVESAQESAEVEEPEEPAAGAPQEAEPSAVREPAPEEAADEQGENAVPVPEAADEQDAPAAAETPSMQEAPTTTGGDAWVATDQTDAWSVEPAQDGAAPDAADASEVPGAPDRPVAPDAPAGPAEPTEEPPGAQR